MKTIIVDCAIYRFPKEEGKERKGKEKVERGRRRGQEKGKREKGKGERERTKGKEKGKGDNSGIKPIYKPMVIMGRDNSMIYITNIILN